MSRTVPITTTRMGASITAYSAISGASSSVQSLYSSAVNPEEPPLRQTLWRGSQFRIGHYLFACIFRGHQCGTLLLCRGHGAQLLHHRVPQFHESDGAAHEMAIDEEARCAL